MNSPGRLRFCSTLGIAAAIACALLVAVPRHAHALDANSTMSEWTEASPAERNRLLEALGPRLTPTFKAKEAEILACLNLAAQSSAHADLPVSEIAKACADAAEPPSNPDQSNDI